MQPSDGRCRGADSRMHHVCCRIDSRHVAGLLNRFTGLLDEEWFLKTHVIIESEASSVVSAIYDACNAIRNADKDRLPAMLAPEPLCDGCFSRCQGCPWTWEDDDFLEDGGDPMAIAERDAAARPLRLRPCP